MDSTRKILQEIADSQDFERLLAFKKAQTWETLSDDDRELLAVLFISLAQREYVAGDSNYLRSFATAAKIAPGNANIYMKQGLVYLNKAEDESGFLLATESFDKAIEINPKSFNAWLYRAIAQLKLGDLLGDYDQIKLADDFFIKAEPFADDDQKRGQLFWQWALCYHSAAKLSGELCDYHSALAKLRVAAVVGLDEAAFWTDYGYVTREVAMLVDRSEMYYQALELFVKAAKLQSDSSEAWTGIALLGHRLYQRSGDRGLFHESDRAFRVLATMGPLSPLLEMGWAQLCLDGGKFQRDSDLLKQSLEHFEKVGECDVEEYAVLSGYGEAQILVGSELERLDLIQSGMEKAKRCLELAPQHGRLWYLHALGLTELGRYYNDEKHFERAVGSLKHGLTLRHDDPVLWYGLAQATYAVGELRRDRSLIVSAVNCFSQVVEFGGGQSSQFFNEWGVALMRLCEISRERKHLELAVEKFEQAIAFHARGRDVTAADRDGLDPEWLYNYGCALDFLGDFSCDAKHYEKAIQVLSQVIILDANFSHARYNLALAFYHLGELVSDIECYHKALELFQSVVEQDSEDETAWTDWGVALISFAQLMRDPARPDISLGLLEQAELKLRHAAALGSTNAYYHLACVYSLTGNFGAAVHYLDRASASDSIPPLEEVANDEWLEDLHRTPKFREWMNRLDSNP